MRRKSLPPPAPAPPPDPALAARRQAEDAEAKEALEVVTATALEKRHASAVENLTAVRNVMPEKKAWKQAREDINSALMLHKRARNLSRRLINPGSGDPTTFEIVQRFSGEAAEVTAKALESYRAAMAKRGRKLVLRPEPKPEPSPAPDAPPTEAEAWQANAEAASEPPPKKPSKTFVAIKRAADWFGMPVEQAGPRSVAIGGAAAAYESTLGGRWNRVRGEGSRQIVSNGKAMKWLTERADAQRKLNEEAAARNTPERIAERKSAGEAAAAAAAASKKAATDERSRRHRDGLAVGGNTFAHRTEIRAAGGDWDAAAKVWLMPDSESAQAMRDLINPPIEVEPDEAPKEAPFEEWKREMFAIDEKVGRIRSEAAKEGKAVLGDYHARHQAAEDMFKDAKYADASAGLIRVEGERVGETDPTLRVYGGGQWFIIEPPDKQDRRVWTIRGNGADGDNWSHSNTTTGIGKDIPWSPELDTLLRGLDIEATKKTISAIEQRARDEVKEVSRTRPPDPRPSSERPSEKQINFALELSKRLEQDDYGSATTYGVDGMTEGMLRRMSRQEVSRIISIVKDEVDYYR